MGIALLVVIILFLVIVLLPLLITTIFFVRTAYRMYHPKNRSLTRTPASYGMDFEPFSVKTNDDYRIYSWLIKSNSSRKTIILCHNTAGNKERLLPQASFLNRAGYNVVLFDFRSHGESDLDTGFFGREEKTIEDLRAVLSYLKKRQGIDPNSLGIMGFSFGTIPAISIAAEDPSIKAIVADSGPSISLDETIPRFFRQISKLPKLPFEYIFVQLLKRVIGIKNYPEFIRSSIQKLHPRPLFLIQGEKDELIPPSNAKTLFRWAREPKKLWIVPNSPHLANYSRDKEGYIKRVTNFYLQYL